MSTAKCNASLSQHDQKKRELSFTQVRSRRGRWGIPSKALYPHYPHICRGVKKVVGNFETPNAPGGEGLGVSVEGTSYMMSLASLHVSFPAAACKCNFTPGPSQVEISKLNE